MVLVPDKNSTPAIKNRQRALTDLFFCNAYSVFNAIFWAQWIAVFSFAIFAANEMEVAERIGAIHISF